MSEAKDAIAKALQGRINPSPMTILDALEENDLVVVPRSLLEAGLAWFEDCAAPDQQRLRDEFAALADNEAHRVAEYHALVASGLSDHEARATAWPEQDCEREGTT